MSSDTIYLIVMGTWVTISAILAGIILQLDGDLDDSFEAIAFWPVIVAGLLLAGAAWCASWLGRGPVLLVQYVCARRSRVRVPRATVVSR